jgi:phosphatidylserine/phosphatidylglycerophosphate/cardiolipin synthase-like enzyme
MFGIVLPPSYGKTQFILGVTERELRAQQSLPCVKPRAVSLADLSENRNIHVFFSPDDNVIDLLLALIAREEKSICVAAYMITDKKVAQKLVEAHKRGVRVELIADTCCIKSDAGNISSLVKHAIPVYVYQGTAPSSAMSNIMHHKFIVFGKNIGNKSFVWTGSFNFTHSAQQYNQENVVIFSDPYAVERFSQHFELLKKRCVSYCLVPKEKQKVAKKTKKKASRTTCHISKCSSKKHERV